MSSPSPSWTKESIQTLLKSRFDTFSSSFHSGLSSWGALAAAVNAELSPEQLPITADQAMSKITELELLYGNGQSKLLEAYFKTSLSGNTTEIDEMNIGCTKIWNENMLILLLKYRVSVFASEFEGAKRSGFWKVVAEKINGAKIGQEVSTEQCRTKFKKMKELYDRNPYSEFLRKHFTRDDKIGFFDKSDEDVDSDFDDSVGGGGCGRVSPKKKIERSTLRNWTEQMNATLLDAKNVTFATEFVLGVKSAEGWELVAKAVSALGNEPVSSAEARKQFTKLSKSLEDSPKRKFTWNAEMTEALLTSRLETFAANFNSKQAGTWTMVANVVNQLGFEEVNAKQAKDKFYLLKMSFSKDKSDSTLAKFFAIDHLRSNPGSRNGSSGDIAADLLINFKASPEKTKSSPLLDQTSLKSDSFLDSSPITRKRKVDLIPADKASSSKRARKASESEEDHEIKHASPQGATMQDIFTKEMMIDLYNKNKDSSVTQLLSKLNESALLNL